MKFLLKVDGDAYAGVSGYKVVLLEIDKLYRKQLLKRKTTFQALRAYEPDVQMVTYVDSCADWCSSADTRLEELLDVGTRSEDPHLINSIAKKPLLVDCARVVITQGGVYWKSTMRHTGVPLDTVILPWESLEAVTA